MFSLISIKQLRLYQCLWKVSATWNLTIHQFPYFQFSVKYLKKTMHKRLCNFLEAHGLFFSMQFGFCNGHLTDHALVSLTENIKSSSNHQKAFTAVNHDIFLRKLETLRNQRNCFELVAVILSKPKQFVSTTDYSSSTYENAIWCPQGSVLSPLIFPIYISDLPNSSKFSSFCLFTDDINIYFESDEFSILTRRVNKELTKA